MPSAADFPRHLVSVTDLTPAQVSRLLERAQALRATPRSSARTLLDGAVVATLFFQPSTRTRLGFEAAALRLGARVTGFADPSTSRSVEWIGESLEDTVQVVSELSDAVVLRHFVAGAGVRAARVAACPVVNGGDGSNEHPTQALSDVWTLWRHLGGVAGAVVAVVGDPGTRVLRSLVLLLARSGVGRLLFLVPPGVPLLPPPAAGIVHHALPADLEAALAAYAVPYEFRGSVEELLVEADAVEMMPIDIPSLEADPRSLTEAAQVTPEQYRITAAKIRATRSRALVLHPGPRKDELHPDVDQLAQGLYFTQVRDSLYLRMAVLDLLAGPRLRQEVAA
ncbi:aspartate carbamoyltransferase catalytic subunit [Streptacidiphilus sp. MAP12-33]|uniref:hypothetical protein n=1 Tax=Streptacidiphilus sp. MAP12-33 TaxID=3156266 RepID=UPI003514CCB8